MSSNAIVPIEATRDRWMDACGASAFLSFLLIVAHVACPPLLGLQLPYAGGGAVVLGIGATACFGLQSRPNRLAVAVVLLGLLFLRALSAVRPDLLIAKHGALSFLDGCALVLLILAAASMLRAAIVQPQILR